MTSDRTARRLAITSMFISSVLAAAKILVGMRANSTSVVSDGLESAADVFAAGLVLFGLIIAAKPPDKEHPYGHGRVEMLSGLVVGMLLFGSGVLIAFRSIQRLFEIQPAPAAYAAWPLVGSIILKLILWIAKRGVARKIRSASLAADAWNDAVDMLSGCTALLALGLTLFDPSRFASADHIGGAAVGLIVIFLGVHVIRDTTSELIDTMPGPESVQQIRDVALQVPGARAIEKCFARKTGLKYHVDLHLEVDPAMTVQRSHEIARQVKVTIKEKLDWVADVLVHVEPFAQPHAAPALEKRLHG